MATTLLSMIDVSGRGGVAVTADGSVAVFGKPMRTILVHNPSTNTSRLYMAAGNNHTVTAGVGTGPLTKAGSPTSHATLEAAHFFINPGETRILSKDNAQFNCLELKCAATESVADVRIAVE